MIVANKADTCACVCAHVHTVMGKVQALGALPARLASQQCLFNDSCEGENAVCLCCMRTQTHTGIRCTNMHILNVEEEGSD